ncbi:hypothetical protein PT974_01220 [Cladobotryum mycophilum]|uniref:Uncharacterized protein n=1 Tax=Cladobotryum mycophilum TaxID=491253 RepID=A0ABR0T3Z6_9HYPO
MSQSQVPANGGGRRRRRQEDRELRGESILRGTFIGGVIELGTIIRGTMINGVLRRGFILNAVISNATLLNPSFLEDREFEVGGLFGPRDYAADVHHNDDEDVDMDGDLTSALNQSLVVLGEDSDGDGIWNGPLSATAAMSIDIMYSVHRNVNASNGNGGYMNGVYANGVPFANGVYVNGVHTNGIHTNGMYANGASDNYHGNEVNGDGSHNPPVNGIYTDEFHANGMHVNGASNGYHGNDINSNGIHTNGLNGHGEHNEAHYNDPYNIPYGNRNYTNGVNSNVVNGNGHYDSGNDVSIKDDDEPPNNEADDSGIGIIDVDGGEVDNNAHNQSDVSMDAVKSNGGNSGGGLVVEPIQAQLLPYQLNHPRRATTSQLPSLGEIEYNENKAFWFSMILEKDPPIHIRGIRREGERRGARFTWHPDRVPPLGRRCWRELMMARLEYLKKHERVKNPTYMRWEINRRTLVPTLVRLETMDEPVPEPPFSELHQEFFLRKRSRSFNG